MSVGSDDDLDIEIKTFLANDQGFLPEHCKAGSSSSKSPDVNEWLNPLFRDTHELEKPQKEDDSISIDEEKEEMACSSCSTASYSPENLIEVDEFVEGDDNDNSAAPAINSSSVDLQAIAGDVFDKLRDGYRGYIKNLEKKHEREMKKMKAKNEELEKQKEKIEEENQELKKKLLEKIAIMGKLKDGIKFMGKYLSNLIGSDNEEGKKDPVSEKEV